MIESVAPPNTIPIVSSTTKPLNPEFISLLENEVDGVVNSVNPSSTSDKSTVKLSKDCGNKNLSNDEIVSLKPDEGSTDNDNVLNVPPSLLMTVPQRKILMWLAMAVKAVIHWILIFPCPTRPQWLSFLRVLFQLWP